MSSTLRSSVTVLLRDAADEVRERRDALTLGQLASLAMLAQGFGCEGFVRVFVGAFADRALEQSKAGG